MNVLLLTADSLRADRTSLFGHRRDTTPFLADLAADAFEFRRAYANGRNTAASFPAVHTSRHASFYEGVGIPASGPPTLAECLGNAGYDTFAVHTNELVSREYNYDRGFDTYADSRAGEDDGGGWRATARSLVGDGPLFEVVKRAHFLSTQYLGVKIFDTADSVSGFGDTLLDWATDADDDWFVWAHYMNPHHPYNPPQEYQRAVGLDPVPQRRATQLSRKMRLEPETVTPEERDTLRGLYDAAVRSWDAEIAATYRSLRAAGELDDTLVVVSADHGELLGEGGRYGHPPVLDQPLLRVPLLFAGGGVDTGETDRQVGLVDLAPTLLGLAGVDVPETMRGRRLFTDDGALRELDARPQFCETGDGEAPLFAAADDRRKVVHDPDAETWQGFELTADALGETASDDPFDALRASLTEHLGTAREGRQRGATVDEERLEADLKALGYLEE